MSITNQLSVCYSSCLKQVSVSEQQQKQTDPRGARVLPYLHTHKPESPSESQRPTLIRSASSFVHFTLNAAAYSQATYLTRPHRPHGTSNVESPKHSTYITVSATGSMTSRTIYIECTWCGASSTNSPTHKRLLQYSSTCPLACIQHTWTRGPPTALAEPRRCACARGTWSGCRSSAGRPASPSSRPSASPPWV